MGASMRNISISKAHLSLCKGTLSWVRFVFNGISRTGAERMFFVELEVINPTLSPDKVVLGYKFNAKISAEDLQGALAGTPSARDIGREDAPEPSYVAVRAGTFGAGAKQIVCYEAPRALVTNKGEIGTVLGCTFTYDTIKGSLSLTKEDISEHPEYMCDAGSIVWDIKYLCQMSFRGLYSKVSNRWQPVGAKATFSGSVMMDGQEYEVSGARSYGYIDYSEVKKGSLPVPFFHISSSRLTSHITGRTMTDSCFVVHGLYGAMHDNVAIAVKLGERTILVPAMKRGVHTIQECVEAPADEGGKRLHWSMSVEIKRPFASGKYVVDVDIMCHTKLLSVRNIERSMGGRRVIRLLAGADGVGTVRLFQYVKKNLVLIDEAHVASALCEFGQEDNATL